MCWLWHAADGQRVEIARSQAPADGIEVGAQLVKQSPSAATNLVSVDCRILLVPGSLQQHLCNHHGQLVSLADHMIDHCVATLQRRLNFSNILSKPLELARLGRKLGYPRIGCFNVLVRLGDATKFVSEIHQNSSSP